MSESGVLYVVATPIGNLEDITLRATRTLQSVDVIAAEDTRSAQRLLSHLKIPRPELVSLFQGNEASRTQLLINKLSHGDEVAIICESGTPGISDPGERLIKAVTDAGIRVEVIPGPVAAITALVGSGLPTDRFLFLGFAPRESGRGVNSLGRYAVTPRQLSFTNPLTGSQIRLLIWQMHGVIRDRVCSRGSLRGSTKNIFA